MRLIKILLIVFLPMMGFSQINGEDEVYLDGDRIEAKFDGGGLEKFHEFVRKEFDYSKVAKTGTMVAAFTIDVEGKVTGIKITQILDAESAKEMIRVLKLCPKWEPAKRGGKPVSIEIKYPMTFTSSKSDELTVVPTQKVAGEEEIFNTAGVETKPEFPGGLREFYMFIGKNYQAPSDKDFKGGKVLVSFVIEKDGSVSDVKIVKDCGFGSGDEAKRVLSISPKWAPATQNNVPVRCEYMLPISLASN